MTGDIDMGDNKILKLADPITGKSATNKKYVDNNFLSRHGGSILGNITMSGQSIRDLNPTPQNNNDAVTKSYVDNSFRWREVFLFRELLCRGILICRDMR